MSDQKCRSCGKSSELMAQVIDPFVDSCYVLCRTCLSRATHPVRPPYRVDTHRQAQSITFDFSKMQVY